MRRVLLPPPMHESISTNRSSRFELRVSLWIYTLALVICCACAATVGVLADRVFVSHLGGKPLPELTSLLLAGGWWFIVGSAPWILAAAWLTLTNAISVSRCVVFAATVTLAIVCLFGFLFIALLLPFMPVLGPISRL